MAFIPDSGASFLVAYVSERAATSYSPTGNSCYRLHPSPNNHSRCERYRRCGTGRHRRRSTVHHCRRNQGRHCQQSSDRHCGATQVVTVGAYEDLAVGGLHIGPVEENSAITVKKATTVGADCVEVGKHTMRKDCHLHHRYMVSLGQSRTQQLPGQDLACAAAQHR